MGEPGLSSCTQLLGGTGRALAGTALHHCRKSLSTSQEAFLPYVLTELVKTASEEHSLCGWAAFLLVAVEELCVRGIFEKEQPCVLKLCNGYMKEHSTQLLNGCDRE